MINILEILKNIPNLEDYVFYSPLFGDVKIKLNENNECYPILVMLKNSNNSTALTKHGLYSIVVSGEVEPMLYPSRQNRDWSTFKVPRKDLLENTPVIFCDSPNTGWCIGKYMGESAVKTVPINKILFSLKWKYIIPIDKFDFNNWSFKEEDNYGTTHKE